MDVEQLINYMHNSQLNGRQIVQVGTLRELQRLFDELVESADTCRLDRYSASEKAGR